MLILPRPRPAPRDPYDRDPSHGATSASRLCAHHEPRPWSGTGPDGELRPGDEVECANCGFRYRLGRKAE